MTPQPRGGQVGADGKVLGVLEEALKRRSLLRLGSRVGRAQWRCERRG